MATDVWKSILKHVHAISPSIASTVNPPATEEDIASLENALHVQLPKAFVNIY